MQLTGQKPRIGRPLKGNEKRKNSVPEEVKGMTIKKEEIGTMDIGTYVEDAMIEFAGG